MSFPENPRHFLGEIDCASATQRICASIRDVPAKVLARITGRTAKAAERWKAGDNAMSAEAIFALAREYAEVRDIVLEACGVPDTISEAEAQLRQVREILEAKRS